MRTKIENALRSFIKLTTLDCISDIKYSVCGSLALEACE